MRIPRPPHRWSVTPKQAVAIQRRLAPRVVIARPSKTIRLVAGVDAAFPRTARHCVAAVILWDLRDQVVVEQHSVTRKLLFPYVPGLLSFREAPAVLSALSKLSRTPDAIMLDGHGLAHPRRFGIACHVGVVLGKVTLGCAKSRLLGEYEEPATERGATTTLTHGGEVIGSVLRTRHGVKPLFVSVGHKIDLSTAERVVLDCAVRYRLPEPTRLADKLVTKRVKRATSSVGAERQGITQGRGSSTI